MIFTVAVVGPGSRSLLLGEFRLTPALGMRSNLLFLGKAHQLMRASVSWVRRHASDQGRRISHDVWCNVLEKEVNSKHNPHNGNAIRYLTPLLVLGGKRLLRIAPIRVEKIGVIAERA